MRDVVICYAKRSAIGKFQGTLASLKAHQITSQLIKDMLQSTLLDATEVDEVILGQVLTAGAGQNPARQAALNAGLYPSTPAWTLNQVCGSGLQSVLDGAIRIQQGIANIIIAGGQESMSQSPYLLPRSHKQLGDINLIDSVLHDGLKDAFDFQMMGTTAERLARDYNIDREQQDQFAQNSQEKAQKAIASGAFSNEITPIRIKDTLFDTDEHPRQTSLESLAALSPVFSKEGSVTAGNSSGINDGAAILLLMNKQTAAKYQLPPLATIRAFAHTGIDPKYMGLGPVDASKKALSLAQLTLEDMDLMECNEAFAAQTLAVGHQLKWNQERLNIHGGAIALGHPIGASGARILTSLIHALHFYQKRYGLACLCVGGGMGVSMIVERHRS